MATTQLTDDERRIRAAEIIQTRQQGKQTLHKFLASAWPHFEGGRKFVDGWAIGAIAEHMQALVFREIPNLLVNQPPRTSKSSLCGVCLTPFTWLHFPTTQFFYTSYSDKLSIRDHVKARRLIESEWYNKSFDPEYLLTDDQNTKIRFDNTAGGYRVASSTDGTTTGEGGDIIVADDPNSARDLSDAKLDGVLDWWRHVVPTRLNDFKTGRKLVVQQRVHERDISGEILANELDGDWVKLVLPMEFEARRCAVTVILPSTNGKKWRDPRTKEGELLWPERIGAEELRKLKTTLGSYATAGQLQQRPAPAEGGIIKRAWWQIWKEPAPPKLNFTMLSVDTAMSKPDESEKKDDSKIAYSSATTWGVFNHPRDGSPCAILLSRWRERVEYPELRKRIIRLSNHYLDLGPLDQKALEPNSRMRPNVVLIEAKNNGISLIQELSRSSITVHKFNPDKLGDKVNRVRLNTPLLESNRFYLPAMPPTYDRLRPWASDFLESVCMFPRASARDDVDTWTQAAWRLQESGWIWVGGDPGQPETFYPGSDMVPVQAIY